MTFLTQFLANCYTSHIPVFAFVRGQHQQYSISDKRELHFLIFGAADIFWDPWADLLLTIHREAWATIDLQKDGLQIIHKEDVKAKNLSNKKWNFANELL